MNWLDLIILCLAGIGLVKGLFDGCIKQVVSLIGLYIAACSASGVADRVEKYVAKLNFLPDYGVDMVSWLIGFMFIIGLFILIGNALNKFLGATPLGVINHLFGGIIGVLIMSIFTSLLLNVVGYLDQKSLLIPRTVQAESKLYIPVKEILPAIFPSDLFGLNE